MVENVLMVITLTPVSVLQDGLANIAMRIWMSVQDKTILVKMEQLAQTDMEVTLAFV